MSKDIGFCSITEGICRKGGECETCSLQHVFVNVEHYAKLLEENRLIELPCKVGTPIWLITWDYDEFNDRYYYATPTTFALEDVVDLGTVIFLTKEEAEAKLAELKGE